MKDKYECTQKEFLEHVKHHRINIERDDGVYRFIRFRCEKSITLWFDLITWPGYLCIAGDCGTYVFSRTLDMFGFFRMRENDFNKKKGVLLNINPGYWGEKLQSIGTNAGYRKFDGNGFESRVKEHFKDYMANYVNRKEKKELWQAIKDEVLIYTDNEHEAYDAVHRFEHNGVGFNDFFDGGGTDKYTFHYIWNLYAIVWGIMEYDKAKQAGTALNTKE